PLTHPVYNVLPDAFDFLIFFAPEHLELTSTYDSANYIAGRHFVGKIDYTGTGKALQTNTAFYGSAGKLLGLNMLDTFNRSLAASIMTHELLHSWAAYIDPSFGLSDGVHWTGRNDIASPLGGWLWVDQSNGTYQVDCLHKFHLDPIDK